jgi:hypothetical protein
MNSFKIVNMQKMKVPKGYKMIPNVVEMGEHDDFHVG